MDLFKKKIFELVKKKDIPQDIRIFNSRFVNKLRNQGTNKIFKKSRLIIQAYNDKKKSLVLT
jgi:ethanolamine utilization protein EutP (predicted NTPase)